MRLLTALQHVRDGTYRTMEPWKAGELDEMARFLAHRADETIEFTFDYADAIEGSDTLQTFVTFANTPA